MAQFDCFQCSFGDDLQLDQVDTGLVISSQAPSLTALMASATMPIPEITITGVAG